MQLKLRIFILILGSNHINKSGFIEIINKLTKLNFLDISNAHLIKITMAQMHTKRDSLRIQQVEKIPIFTLKQIWEKKLIILDLLSVQALAFIKLFIHKTHRQGLTIITRKSRYIYSFTSYLFFISLSIQIHDYVIFVPIFFRI